MAKVNREALLVATGQNLKRLLSRRVWGRRPPFRVSRVQAAVPTGETFDRPADFDLAAHWAAARAAFAAMHDRYPVTVRVAPEGVPILLQAFGEGLHALLATAGESDAAGWRTLVLHFETTDAARGRLLGFGTLVEVLGSPELRATMGPEAARIAAFYAGAPQAGAILPAG